ncbi:protein hemingway isoform X2 [Drosophila sechellia]|uniref:protein hemingway isoform X2 n=1 Tax=Drosophila sechellia TaxID=7238 RepID=UPI0013DE4ED9|nr:protein hemingway isoform X2 [Drosophila sechellia]
MSGAAEHSDEESYAEESFEEDSESEVEVEEEEVEYIEPEVSNPSDALLLEESDTQSESDVKAEFFSGNVSPPLQELTISEFSLNPQTASRPQPHARRQLGARMVSYLSSSSDDESQVVITKTVAEVNQLILRMDTPPEDETPSVRTLMPGSAHSQVKDEDEGEDEDDDEIDDEDDNENDDENDDEDAEVEEIEEEEEEIPGDEDDAQSDGSMGRQSADESDEDEGTDVEVEQLEEDEPIVTAVCEKPVQKEMPPAQKDIVSLVDASDNSSEHSVATMCAAGDETDNTLAESPRLRKQESLKEQEEPEDQIEDHMAKHNAHLNSCDSLPTSQPDLARVRYLEQQMTQMSELIMKSFQINGGAPNSQAFEQLAMATEMLQQRSDRRGDTESEMSSMTETTMTSARSLGGGIRPLRMRMERSQEALLTTRSSKLLRPKCRCPSEADLIEHEQELDLGHELPHDLASNVGLDMGMGEGYLVDECGQGDGLMRHPQQRKPMEFNRRAVSGTPSTFTSGGCEYQINVSRSRCSNDKINYKNLGRKSFSFTNPQVREIERQNQILLRKMMTVKPTATIKASTSSIKINGPEKRQTPPAPRLTSAAVNRKKNQRQIDLDNDLLKRKLEAIGTRRPQFK